MNRIELQIKKDTFFGKLKKAELIFNDRQTGEQHVIDITDVNFLMMKVMVDTMSTFREHDGFYISRDYGNDDEDVIKVVHSKQMYIGFEHLVATVSKADFLEMLDELLHVKR
ncbi:hypothetical protein bcgnr5378_05510 [Bacillus cereus]|uniref:Uncharacterized protein n=1 Tax=Bacillus cereus TaxID=1396 RepID=A0A164LCL3_BACCE|nr:hypothetical protein [Bacillus cereus]KZD55670.1 hypothetical protein B4088_5415 [Bacillus cereus]